jgi:hypothetical protein
MPSAGNTAHAYRMAMRQESQQRLCPTEPQNTPATPSPRQQHWLGASAGHYTAGLQYAADLYRIFGLSGIGEHFLFATRILFGLSIYMCMLAIRISNRWQTAGTCRILPRSEPDLIEPGASNCDSDTYGMVSESYNLLCDILCDSILQLLAL